MNIYMYPCEKFSSKIILEIANGNEFKIRILDTWRTNFLMSKIINFITNDKSEEKSWEIFLCIILNPIFFSAYFYAVSENYKITQNEGSEKIIRFQKNYIN